MPIILVYLGLLAAFLGAICVLKPIRIFGLPTRARALLVLAIGIVLFFAGLFAPVAVTRVARREMAIDDYLPEYQANEVHSCRIHASPEQVYHAIQTVTPLDIRFFAMLMWLRSPHRPGDARYHQLGAKPMMAVLSRMGFRTMADQDSVEIAVGGIGRFWGGRSKSDDRELKAPRTPSVGRSARISTADDFLAFDRPDYAKTVMNFRIEDEGAGWCTLRTETRVLGTDAPARRKFAMYWRVIYPGSAIIRREWLQAIKRRAEGVSRES